MKRSKLRVAYVGPTPASDGGVTYMAGQLLHALADAGMAVEAFMAGRPSDIPVGLLEHPSLDLRFAGSRWKHDQWYSSHPLSRFATGQLARGLSQHRAVGQVAERHRAAPFDVIYQFSQIELGLPTELAKVPLIVHPETHAAGELRWHKREVALARAAEPLPTWLAGRAMLETRALNQGRFLRRATTVIAPSRAFADLIIDDHRLEPSRVKVVPNIVDVRRFQPDHASRGAAPLQLLFISRLAVRKGVELIVELSHRLADLAGTVELHVIGDHGVWSDYRRLLDEANARVLRIVGAVPGPEVARRLASASIVLLPSHYEPFGLTVGEALASGVPVVTSDAVGASEGVDVECCRPFPAGDAGAFETAVRGLLRDLDSDKASHLCRRSRDEALRLFAPAVVGRSLAEIVAAVAAPARG